MHKPEAQPPAPDTPNAVLYEGARLDAIAEGQEEQHEEKDGLDRKTGEEETNEAATTRTKKKQKKKSKKKRVRNAKRKPAAAAPSHADQADEMASAMEAPQFSNAIQNAMRESLGAMTASISSWQQEFADVDKLLARTMSLINKSRETRGDTALNMKPTDDTSKSEASQPSVTLMPEKTADPKTPASPSDPFALFLYR